MSLCTTEQLAYKSMGHCMLSGGAALDLGQMHHIMDYYYS